MYPTTPTEAKSLGVLMYFNGRQCKRGHTAPRYASTRQCSVCISEHSANWNMKNLEKRRAITRKWQTEKRSAFIESTRKYVEANRDVIRERAKRYATNNKHVRAANQRKRDATKIKATPWWLTPEHLAQIKRIYQLAARMSSVSSEPYQVDHIVPLRSKRVCGLHVPWNLRVVTAKENNQKSNVTWPDV